MNKPLKLLLHGSTIGGGKTINLDPFFDRNLSYKLDAIPEEISTLALWASAVDSHATFEEIRCLPVSVLAGLYNATTSKPYSALRPAGPQWNAFAELLRLVDASSSEEDLDAILTFQEWWKNSSNLIFEYEVALRTGQGLYDKRVTVPWALPDCYTTYAIKTGMDEFFFRHQLRDSLLHSVLPLFTPWYTRPKASDEVDAPSSELLAEEKRNVVAPLRIMAAHFFTKTPDLFDALFNPTPEPNGGS